MPVTLHLYVWHALALINLGIWGWAILAPGPAPSGGLFDFGPAISFLLRGVGAIIATLGIWLVYFAGLAVLR